MAIDLTTPMTDEQISRLDYFEKAQLYHNVYLNETYNNLPKSLRSFYLDDPGLRLVKSTIQSASMKEPYEIEKLIKALAPSKPQTHQEIYNRALYLANVCDTSVEKILRSGMFGWYDFIPAMTNDTIEDILTNKNTGLLKPLAPGEYTPAPDPTPTPGPGGDTTFDGDYAEEEKIYFTMNGDAITCDKTYNQVITKLPKLPEAELLLGSGADYQNILNISCGYNQANNQIDFNFIKMYESTIQIFTIHFGQSAITLEENILNINGGQA